MLAISNEDVMQVLTPADCIEAIEAVYREMEAGDAIYRSRSEYESPIRHGERYTFAVAEGISRGEGVAAVRLRSDIIVHHGDVDTKYCISPGNYCGLIFLFDVTTGAPLAMLNDAIVQQMRVAATAAVAARHMCRPEASTLGILGSSGQARTHADAYTEVFPLERIKVYSPNPDNRRAFARETAERLGIEVTALDDPRDVVEGSDIVAACTISNSPVFEAAWVAPGTFISSVRDWSEIGPDVYELVDRVVVHQPPEINFFKLGDEAAWAEADRPIGDTSPGSLTAHGGGRQARVPRDAPTIVDLLAGRVVGRADDREVTYFLNNFGTGLQFAACGARAYRKVVERGLGTPLDLELFLEQLRD